MFTSIEAVKQQLEGEGWNNITLEYINKGVMTDTYKMVSGEKCYAVRCYPISRSWLAKVESGYLKEFKKNGVKAPTYISANQKENPISYLIYEWVEGDTLKEKYDSLSKEEQEHICKEVIENYYKINEIKSKRYGSVAKGRIYEHHTWKRFLQTEIEKSRRYFKREKDMKHVHVCDGLYEYVDNISEPTANLVWSDLSLENIIISEDNHLAAFIDFEGMISGDPLLGFGYLLSQSPKHTFTQCLLESLNVSQDEEKEKLLDFYAVFRYIRIAPYSKGLTPNNTQREPFDDFLPYVKDVEEQFENKCGCWNRIKRVCKLMWKSILLLLFSVVICILALLGTYCCYTTTLNGSIIEKKIPKVELLQLIIQEEVPSWFCITDSSICTYKVIEEAEKKVLYHCVSPLDSVADSPAYSAYISAVNQLAFQSQTSFGNTENLLWLTVCLVILGCSTRTFYDYIGWVCYKKNQDMDTWWPWYLFRPMIAAPVAAFLLVAFRTSMFSGLFSGKDLNTYLVVAFLAGFAMMDFIKMLRRASKALFGE